MSFGQRRRMGSPFQLQPHDDYLKRFERGVELKKAQWAVPKKVRFPLDDKRPEVKQPSKSIKATIKEKSRRVTGKNVVALEHSYRKYRAFAISHHCFRVWSQYTHERTCNRRHEVQERQRFDQLAVKQSALLRRKNCTFQRNVLRNWLALTNIRKSAEYIFIKQMRKCACRILRAWLATAKLYNLRAQYGSFFMRKFRLECLRMAWSKWWIVIRRATATNLLYHLFAPIPLERIFSAWRRCERHANIVASVKTTAMHFIAKVARSSSVNVAFFAWKTTLHRERCNRACRIHVHRLASVLSRVYASVAFRYFKSRLKARDFIFGRAARLRSAQLLRLTLNQWLCCVLRTRRTESVNVTPRTDSQAHSTLLIRCLCHWSSWCKVSRASKSTSQRACDAKNEVSHARFGRDSRVKSPQPSQSKKPTGRCRVRDDAWQDEVRKLAMYAEHYHHQAIVQSDLTPPVFEVCAEKHARFPVEADCRQVWQDPPRTAVGDTNIHEHPSETKLVAALLAMYGIPRKQSMSTEADSRRDSSVWPIASPLWTVNLSESAEPSTLVTMPFSLDPFPVSYDPFPVSYVPHRDSMTCQLDSQRAVCLTGSKADVVRRENDQKLDAPAECHEMWPIVLSDRMSIASEIRLFPQPPEKAAVKTKTSSDSQPPPVARENQPPPVAGETQPPVVAGENQLPPVVSEYHAPPIAGETQPPVVADKNQPPVVVSATQPPPVVSEYQPPPVAGKNQPPPVAGKTQPPPVVSEYQPPGVAGENQPAPVAGKTQPPVAAGKNQPRDCTPAQNMNPHESKHVTGVPFSCDISFAPLRTELQNATQAEELRTRPWIVPSSSMAQLEAARAYIRKAAVDTRKPLTAHDFTITEPTQSRIAFNGQSIAKQDGVSVQDRSIDDQNYVAKQDHMADTIQVPQANPSQGSRIYSAHCGRIQVAEDSRTNVSQGCTRAAEHLRSDAAQGWRTQGAEDSHTNIAQGGSARGAERSRSNAAQASCLQSVENSHPNTAQGSRFHRAEDSRNNIAQGCCNPGAEDARSNASQASRTRYAGHGDAALGCRARAAEDPRSGAEQGCRAQGADDSHSNIVHGCIAQGAERSRTNAEQAFWPQPVGRSPPNAAQGGRFQCAEDSRNNIALACCNPGAEDARSNISHGLRVQGAEDSRSNASHASRTRYAGHGDAALGCRARDAEDSRFDAAHGWRTQGADDSHINIAHGCIAQGAERSRANAEPACWAQSVENSHAYAAQGCRFQSAGDSRNNTAQGNRNLGADDWRSNVGHGGSAQGAGDSRSDLSQAGCTRGVGQPLVDAAQGCRAHGAENPPSNRAPGCSARSAEDSHVNSAQGCIAQGAADSHGNLAQGCSAQGAEHLRASAAQACCYQPAGGPRATTAQGCRFQPTEDSGNNLAQGRRKQGAEDSRGNVSQGRLAHSTDGAPRDRAQGCSLEAVGNLLAAAQSYRARGAEDLRLSITQGGSGHCSSTTRDCGPAARGVHGRPVSKPGSPSGMLPSSLQRTLPRNQETAIYSPGQSAALAMDVPFLWNVQPSPMAKSVASLPASCLPSYTVPWASEVVRGSTRGTFQLPPGVGQFPQYPAAEQQTDTTACDVYGSSTSAEAPLPLVRDGNPNFGTGPGAPNARYHTDGCHYAEKPCPASFGNTVYVKNRRLASMSQVELMPKCVGQFPVESTDTQQTHRVHSKSPVRALASLDLPEFPGQFPGDPPSEEPKPIDDSAVTISMPSPWNVEKIIVRDSEKPPIRDPSHMGIAPNPWFPQDGGTVRPNPAQVESSLVKDPNSPNHATSGSPKTSTWHWDTQNAAAHESALPEFSADAYANFQRAATSYLSKSTNSKRRKRRSLSSSRKTGKLPKPVASSEEIGKPRTNLDNISCESHDLDYWAE